MKQKHHKRIRSLLKFEYNYHLRRSLRKGRTKRFLLLKKTRKDFFCLNQPIFEKKRENASGFLEKDRDSGFIENRDKPYRKKNSIKTDFLLRERPRRFLFFRADSRTKIELYRKRKDMGVLFARRPIFSIKGTKSPK